MPTAFFRDKRKPGITREKYERWVIDFVYPHVEKIPSVVSQRIYQIEGALFGEKTYDVMEVITFTNLEDYLYDLQHNPAAKAIAEELPHYVEVLDMDYGTFIPPGVSREGEPDRPRREVTKKWLTAQHIIEPVQFEIPTLPGHIVGAGRSGGMGIFEDNEERDRYASLAIRFLVDMTNDTGLHWLYTVYEFEDGSTFVTLGQGTTTSINDGKGALFKGTLTFEHGSGRFEGIKGVGSYEGRRLASFVAEAETYLDVVATYSLPD
ncbi:MAG: REDY-like protein HapK [Acidobacteriota bacterium]|jgi:hypothetical protein|nr:REDY-like protein HapK [Acidobacteriota bacterium]